jgi:NhaP-type Na+/H+ or K+/H+ antiporter
MHSSPEFIVILIISFILVIGAAVRMITKYFGLPYTIVVMLVGMAVGYTLDHTAALKTDPEHSVNYTVIVTKGGALGEAAFRVSSADNLKGDVIATIKGQAEYEIGLAGVKFKFDMHAKGTTFVRGNSCVVKSVKGHDHGAYVIDVKHGGNLEPAEGHVGYLNTLAHPETISPDLIIFIFLPILIFESAYSLEVHSFQRSLGTVMVLAIPVLLVATAVTGFSMFYLLAGSWKWGILPCLVFGSLISATDPVAVVALLRDLGAPKRLGLLIEGESLLNDGTAIVIFSLLLTFFEPGTEFHFLGALGKFLKVAGGGFVVGLVLAWLVSFWLSKTFNAPLIEITLTLALGYGCMLIGEGFLHVSGVIAIVTAGLYMKGPGRTNISPEVHHFLHQFLEMLGYLANTLIFFLVGIVVAVQLVPILAGDGRWIYLGVTLGTFIAIVIIRVVLLTLFRPVMNLVGDEVTKSETKVMAWGGLRGAVSLALALIVSQNANIDPDVRSQILLLAAGVVLLTIIVNGATMGKLLKALGFDKNPPGERLAELVTHSLVLENVSNRITEASRSRDLRTVDWSDVSKSLDERRETLHEKILETREELKSAGPAEASRGTWTQILNIEREAYWTAFSRGTLGASAVRNLDHEIDLELDRLGTGDGQPKLSERGQMIPTWHTSLAERLTGGGEKSKAQFNSLSLRFDLCRAATLASEHVLEEIDHMHEMDPSICESMKKAYKDYHNTSKERLEDMRANLPELANAIETQLAHRIQLNFERDQYNHLSHHGAMDAATAGRALADVEVRMKQLLRNHPTPKLPSLVDLCQRAPLFAGLEPKVLEEISTLASENVFAPQDVIFKQGDKGDSMIIISRGAAGVYLEVDEQTLHLDTFGGGDILGEMALIADQPRTATVKAVTTVTTGLISRSDFAELMEKQPELRERVRSSFAARAFDNLLRSLARYKHLGHKERLEWFKTGETIEIDANGTLESRQGGVFFLAIGELVAEGRYFKSPALIRSESFEKLTAKGDCWVAHLGVEA